MRRILRPLVALTAGLALLALTAAPGAATTGTIVAGALTVTGSLPAIDADLEPCSTTSVVIGTDSTTSATGTWGITLAAPFTASGGNYVLSATFSSTTALVTIDKTTDTFTVAGFTLTGVTIRPSTGAGSCVPTGTSVCGAIVMVFSGLTGPWVGTVSLPDLDGAAALDGTGTVAAVGCTAPWSSLNGKTVAIDDMVSFY